jgi:pyrroloquinoline quinone biosynthesis protein B
MHGNNQVPYFYHMNIRKYLLTLALSITVSGIQAQNVIVLGVAQDGGFPHIGCQAKCQEVYDQPEMKRFVVSLAVVDSLTHQWWLVETTPDFTDQLQYFQELTNGAYPYLPTGILITHAHIGHYTGLMELGREALGSKNVPVYCLPKLGDFLEKNGPWSQLVSLQNIELNIVEENELMPLNENISFEAFTVPHRDEFSETAGFRINTFGRNILFIPDIDKWSKWAKDIREEVKTVDFAFLDASFYQDGELPNRSISEVPHPFVTETMKLFQNESNEVKNKVHFIHLNHTNPLMWDKELQHKVRQEGFEIPEQGKNY